MKFSEFINEAKAPVSGSMALMRQLIDLMGYRKLALPSAKVLDPKFLDQAVDEAVRHWNGYGDRYTPYPYGDDMNFRNKATSIVARLNKLKPEDHNPLMDEYFAAVRKIAEIGEAAEAYGKLVSSLGTFISMLNTVVTRTDGYKDKDEEHQAHKAFVKAGMTKLGATIDPARD